MARQSLLQKIWASHRILPVVSGEDALLYVDRCLIHEESSVAFDGLREASARLRNPSQTVAFTDHYAPTKGGRRDLAGVADPEIRAMLSDLESNAKQQGVRHFGLNHVRQGIMHVVAAEMGYVLPGMIVVGSDSHTSTAGAFGAYAFGLGQTQLKQVFMTQTIWRCEPRSMRVAIDGPLAPGTTAKDLILFVISQLGTNGAKAHVVEYAGPCIASMSMEERMTVCNMSIEMGAESGIIGPDETTFAYLEKCPSVPAGGIRQQALQYWRGLPSDHDTAFDREVCFDVKDLGPTVTWGTSLEDAIPIDGRIPDPMQDCDLDRRARKIRALTYMDLKPGTALTDVPIDLVFIGSCTNSRIEDLRGAASILRDRRVSVPSVVSPGSRSVKRQAEAEGIHTVFLQAGFEWRDSGCSMCVGSNGDTVGARLRCASSSPRNFEGRQGVGARTHIMSPQMAAAAAVTGRLTDVRTMLG